MKRAVFATICLFCIVVWPAAAQISPDLVAMAPAGEVDRLITTREFEINKPFAGDMTLLSSACLKEDGARLSTLCWRRAEIRHLKHMAE